LELATGGELFEKIVNEGAYSELEAKRIFTQMLKAVEYLHSHGIVHRDLKPENILLEGQGSRTIVKITDFGLARIVGEQEMMTTLCGTPQYVAPEIIVQSQMSSQEVARVGYNKSVDMWSLGAILYVLLSGTPPFDEDRGNLFTLITKGKFEFYPEFWGEVSEQAKDLVSKLMTVNPTERITVEQALKHPWIAVADVMSPTKHLKNVQNNLRKNKSKNGHFSPIKIPHPHDSSDTEYDNTSPTNGNGKLKRKPSNNSTPVSTDKPEIDDDRKKKISKKLF